MDFLVSIMVLGKKLPWYTCEFTNIKQ